MAFLDNSGDIILDAVLTDTGRYRLAKADGSFRVAKFALGDDEINYALYDKNNASGSAYYDLSILQTPVLEAFTNNASSLKSKLTTISRNDILYLPVLKLNDKDTSRDTCELAGNEGLYLVTVNEDTQDALNGLGTNIKGIIYGLNINGGSRIQIDQGIDSVEISPAFSIDQDLKETQYIIEIDNRLGKIASVSTNNSTSTAAALSYLDDDQIASYFFSLGTDSAFVQDNNVRDDVATEVIRGPRGTKITFKILASVELNSSEFLFNQLGSVTNLTNNSATISVNYIDTTVRVMGATTGYRIDIPVRFVRI
jgi:hypothetical protein